MKLLILLISLLSFIFTTCNAYNYAYFYPPSKTDMDAVGYIVAINQPCLSYDAQGWSAIATVNQKNDINLQLYNNTQCKGGPAYENTFENGNYGPYEIPFNHYDPNKLHLVSLEPLYEISEPIMVMQFYPVTNECEGPAPIMKMFLNSTAFNSTNPYSLVYCEDMEPMNKVCFNNKCQIIPYPNNCSQYFNPTINSDFVCRTGSPVPSSSSSSENYSSSSMSGTSSSSNSDSSSGSSNSGFSSGSSNSGSSNSGSGASGASSYGSGSGSGTGSSS